MSKATFKNNPTNIAINRINHDILKISSAENKKISESEHIYFKFYNDNNNTKFNTVYYQLIIGPENTPYEGGFYFFKAQFPDQYPFFPMKMKTLTQGANVRKHPNLYKCGKCCFSFLGTWSGPPWTACQNPNSVAFSMRSVLTELPLKNEPGWEHNASGQSLSKFNSYQETYAELIKYFNLKYGICSILEKLLSEKKSETVYIDKFREEVINYAKKNIDKYLLNLEYFKDKNNNTVKSPTYSFSLTYDYYDLKNRFIKIKKTILTEDKQKSVKQEDNKKSVNELKFVNNIQNEVVINTNNTLPQSKAHKKIKIKKKPNENPEQYDVGFIKEYYNNKFIVKEYKKGKQIVKKWYVYKN
jgi:ubiquitin-conjugating enzyme E2 Z